MARSTAKLVEVLFLGPTHRLEAFGQFVNRGESALFTEAEVFALSADDRIHLEVLTPITASSAAGGEPPEPEAESGAGHHETHEKKE